jgi:hypothetical protein
MLDIQQNSSTIIRILNQYLRQFLGLHFPQIIIKRHYIPLQQIDILHRQYFIAIVQGSFQMVVEYVETVDWSFAVLVFDDCVWEGENTFLDDDAFHGVVDGL